MTADKLAQEIDKALDDMFPTAEVYNHNRTVIVQLSSGLRFKVVVSELPMLTEEETDADT